MKIMVIDDNEAAAEGLSTLLSFIGHDVRIGFDGPQGIELAREFEPDVAILDIGLPGMDGFELAQTLKSEHGPRIAMIALSGYGQTADKLKARRAGFAFHLLKPAGIEDVQRVLHQIAEEIPA